MRTGDGTELVGRGLEVQALRDAVGGCAAGRPAVLALSGEPGIGKTRLLDELCEQASEAGLRVLRAGGDEMLRTRPFGVISEAMGIRPSARDERLRAIAVMLRAAVLASGGDLGSATHVIVDDIADLVEQWATERPLAVVVDDLQWADEGTLLCLRALARGSTGLPVLLAVAARTGGLPPPAGRVLDDLGATGTALRLGGLDRASAVALCGSQVPAASVESAAGNPFLLTALAETGAEQPAGAGVPERVRAELRRRAVALGNGAVEVLRYAALLGNRTSAGTIAAALDCPMPEVARALERGVEHALLVVDGHGFSFRHDLIRQAVLDDVPAPLLSTMHTAVGRVLAAEFADAPLVAMHLVQGERPEDPEVLQWLRRGVLQSRRVSPTVAVDLLAVAEQLVTDPTTREELTLELMWALAAIGHVEECVQRAEALLACFPADDVAASAHACIGLVSQRTGELTAARAHFDQAATLVDGGSAMHAAYLADAATSRALLGDADTEEVARRALENATPGARCEALCALAWSAHGRGDIEAAIDLGREAVALADSGQAMLDGGNPMPRLYLGLAMTDGATLDDARRTLNRGRADADRHGSVAQLPWYEWALALVDYVAGQWSDAAAHAAAGLALAADVRTDVVVPPLRGLTARLAVHTGQPVPSGLSGPWASWAIPDADPRAAWRRAKPARGIVLWSLLGPDVVRRLAASGDAGAALAVAHEVGTVCGKPAAAVSAACIALARQDARALHSAAEALANRGRTGLALGAFEDAGSVYLAQRDRRAAASSYRAALDGYAAAGAAADAERLDGLLGRISGRAASVRPIRATSGWDSLTESEANIARLVAGGMRNRDVADALFLSRYTVESHLKRVFTKLGVQSRVELALLVNGMVSP